jgi:hypothetical protein
MWKREAAQVVGKRTKVGVGKGPRGRRVWMGEYGSGGVWKRGKKDGGGRGEGRGEGEQQVGERAGSCKASCDAGG